VDDAQRPQDELEGLTYTTDTVQELLAGLDFPASRDEVVSQLERRNAPDDVVEGLRDSGIEQFTGIKDVMSIVGGYAV
jgi:hypothetical protein